MNAYLFSSAVTSTRTLKGGGVESAESEAELANQPQRWDHCVDQIIVAPTAEDGEKAFVDWLTAGGEEAPITREINQMVGSQLIDQLLGEAGESAFDWPEICRRADASLEAQTDYFEQGNWVDVNAAMPEGALPASIKALQAAVPAEVGEGLNWAAEKQFFFIVNALRASSAAPPAEGGFTIFEETAEEEASGEPALPELAERDATALVEARNAVAAAWLWKRFAATTPLAGNRVQIIPWCGAFGFEAPKPSETP